MDIATVTQMIGALGFPIAACIALFVYLMRESEAHKEEVNRLNEALVNNTIALTKLCDRLDNREV